MAITAPEVAVTEVIDALNTRLPRAVPALDMILEALHVNLWPVLDALGFDEDKARPRAYAFAGEPIGEEDGWPAVLVGGALNMQEFGMGHIGEDEVAVTCAFAPQISREQFRISLDVATVVQGIFYHPTYRANMRDPDDATRLLWNEIHPVGLRLVPPDFPHYAGWQSRFVLRQPPQSKLWNDRIS